MRFRLSRSSLDIFLAVLAGLGLLVVVQILAYRDTVPHHWLALTVTLLFCGACLVFIRDRENLDAFLGSVAAFFTLCTVAVAVAGDSEDPRWWPFLLGFAGTAAGLVLLTRRRRAILAAVAIIVGIRLAVYVFLA